MAVTGDHWTAGAASLGDTGPQADTRAACKLPMRRHSMDPPFWVRSRSRLPLTLSLSSYIHPRCFAA